MMAPHNILIIIFYLYTQYYKSHCFKYLQKKSQIKTWHAFQIQPKYLLVCKPYAELIENWNYLFHFSLISCKKSRFSDEIPFFPEKYNKPAAKLLQGESAYNRSICFGNFIKKIYWGYTVSAPCMLISELPQMLLCSYAGHHSSYTMDRCFQDVQLSPTAAFFLQNVIFNRKNIFTDVYLFRNHIHLFHSHIGLMF